MIAADSQLQALSTETKKHKVTLGNFAASNQDLGYRYLLTLAGILPKASMTGPVLKRRMAACEALPAEIVESAKSPIKV